MNKLILLLFITLVFACSSDSSDGGSENNFNIDDRPKVVTWTRERSYCPQPFQTFNFIYENGKVISGNANIGEIVDIFSGECTTEGFTIYSFTIAYQNDLIFSINTQYEILWGENSNRSQLITYEYNEDDLIISKTTLVYEDGVEINSHVNNYEWTNNNLIMSTYYSNGNIESYTEFDTNYNRIQNVSYSETGDQCITNYETNYNVIYPYFAYGIYGSVAPPTYNGWISINSSCEDDIDFFDYEVDENGYVTSVTRTKSNDPDFYSTTRYYFE